MEAAVITGFAIENAQTVRRRGCLLRLLVVSLLAALCSSRDVSAQKSKFTTYEVEAAYLYQFGKFVQWPAAAAQDNRREFSICILGRDPFGEILDATIKGQSIGGQPLMARRIASVQEAGTCKVLFIAESEADNVERIMAGLKQLPVLTVSEISDFAKQGGIIQFVIAQNRVRFQVNLASAERTGMMLSSQLLKVAVSVQGASIQENK